MFKDVAVCLGGILFLTSALAGECNVGEYANGDICSSCPVPIRIVCQMRLA